MDGGDTMRLMGSRLAVRFAVLLVGMLLVTVGVYAVWSNGEQQRASEQKVLEEARLLSQQMASAWDYVDSVQDNINYNSDGRYDFKGIYCSVAGKSIALRFTQQTDCVIRYTRENPRTGTDAPDSFEAEALAAFLRGEQELYCVAEYEGRQVFRYVSAISLKHGCLSCHGEPRGEFDETGYPKEGMQVGDLAGAVSLIIPLEQYQAEAASRAGANVLLFVVLAVVIVACTSFALYRWVTRPLSRLAEAAQEVGSGRFATSMDEGGTKDEIADLAAEFASMELRLKDFYGRLEEQVHSRTVQLTEANDKLAEQRDEIARMNGELMRANKLLRKENEYQSTFLATMSHELRTPLAAIIAFVDVWLRSPRVHDDDDVSLMNEIKLNGKRLLETINNALDAASIEAHRYEVDIVPVDLIDVANEVEALVAPLAEEGGLVLHVDVDPSMPLVATDPEVVRKMLVNLLGNAVKFTEEGGSVELAIAVDERAHEVVMAVADTGIGIPERDLKLIFERFRQADSSISRKYGGSGLGLSLVKDMAELLGGTVEVSSLEGEGSVFTVRVPFRFG